ncbi:TetR/AcrR family transcriptional regulator [Micromonospora sp. NPDC047074]|uniref:TetR/AcrR family transcriptional regulator n=1 Tax=Micromonospora sp. NPDC047074 TaxID=3154339 RepID=UPI0033ECF152
MTNGNGHEARRRRTREAILAGASQLFDEHGYATTTVTQIAARANVSERTFYMHFPAKEDVLFAHVYDFAEIAWRVADETDTADPVERVGRAVHALIDAACADDALARQARIRAALGTTGRLPRSLAAHLMALANELTLRIARSTMTAVHSVAPMVGAAIGAVEAAGLVGAQETTDPRELHRRMVAALDAALLGFRTGSGERIRPASGSLPAPTT